MSRLATMHVQVLVAGWIGEAAIHVGAAHGIAVVRGLRCGPKSALAYARGELEDSGLVCARTCKAIASICQ